MVASGWLVAIAAILAPPQAALAARPAPPPAEPAGYPLVAGPPMRSPSLPSIPNASSDSELYSDTCTSPSDCFAVGFYVNRARAKLGQSLRFNGEAWSRVSVPEPGGGAPSDYDYIDAVACPSRHDCWAVGYYGNHAKASVNEALQWKGRKWATVPTPQPAGAARQTDRNELHGVACITASDCWAVGDYTNTVGAYLNEALHWNGKRWEAVATPNPNGTARGEQNVTYSVSCSSRSACMSLGYGRNRAGAYVNEAMRWNGRRWVAISIPQPGGRQSQSYGYLEGLACLSASDCWAAGGYRNAAGAYLNEALQWNGKTWTQVATPNPGGSHSGSDNELVALSCTSPTNCWAVGYYYNNSMAQLNEALHWDGTTWSLATTPQPGGTASNHNGNGLNGISCASATDCWAVGYTFDPRGPARNQALLWNGSAWSAG
jgi:hypothetical protein